MASCYYVFDLSRSENFDLNLKKWDVEPLHGDLQKSEDRLDIAGSCDSVVQVATTFTTDTGVVDPGVVAALEKP